MAMRRFEHYGDPSNLWCQLESGELIGVHDQVGAWSLVDVVAVNAEKLIIEVALERPSLRVKLLLDHRKGNLVCSTLCLVDILVLMSSAFLLGFAVPRGGCRQ